MENKSIVEVVSTAEFHAWCNSAMQDVFQSLFQANVNPMEKTSAYQDDLDISAVVAFMTENVEALLQLSCSKDTVLKLIHHIHGSTKDCEKKMLLLGEVVNIVFGILKENLNKYDLNYEKCLPIVVIGRNHEILNLNSTEALTLMYNTPFGAMNLNVGVNKRFQKSKSA